MSRLGLKHLDIQIFSHELTSKTLFSLLISPVVKKTTAFTVLRKAVITVAEPFTENQNEVKVPDGKAFCCVPAAERQ